MMLLKQKVLLFVEYSFVQYPYHIYLYNKHISNIILLNFYYVSKISIYFLCLKILNITDMVEVFFDLYSHSQICTTVLMPIYYQIKFLVFSLARFLYILLQKFVGDKKHALSFYSYNKLSLLFNYVVDSDARSKSLFKEGHIVSVGKLSGIASVFPRHVKPESCPFQTQPTSNNSCTSVGYQGDSSYTS